MNNKIINRILRSESDIEFLRNVGEYLEARKVILDSDAKRNAVKLFCAYTRRNDKGYPLQERLNYLVRKVRALDVSSD